LTEHRSVTGQALAFDEALIGRRLAPPWRRGLALAIDASLLVVPTMAVALGASVLALRLSQPVAFAALREMVLEEPSPERARALGADVAPMLVEVEAIGLPVDLAHAVAHGDRAAVERLMATTDVVLAIGDAPGKEGAVVVPLQRLIPPGARTLALFGVPALYFTLCHRGRRGATLGKRLLGISVRSLDGRPLGMLGSLERFGGYFSVPGTVGIGLVELWRHPLRQLGHDRGAGTIVVLEEASGRSSEPDPPLAATAASPPGRSRPGRPSAAPKPAPSSGRGGGRPSRRRRGR
jgi:hypothetical protein